MKIWIRYVGQVVAAVTLTALLYINDCHLSASRSLLIKFSPLQKFTELTSYLYYYCYLSLKCTCAVYIFK